MFMHKIFTALLFKRLCIRGRYRRYRNVFFGFFRFIVRFCVENFGATVFLQTFSVTSNFWLMMPANYKAAVCFCSKSPACFLFVWLHSSQWYVRLVTVSGELWLDTTRLVHAITYAVTWDIIFFSIARHCPHEWFSTAGFRETYWGSRELQPGVPPVMASNNVLTGNDKVTSNIDCNSASER